MGNKISVEAFFRPTIRHVLVYIVPLTNPVRYVFDLFEQ